MVNSLLCTCRQLYQPRFCMQFLSQTTLIHEVRINITIVRSMINQNRNNLIIKLTVHLNDRCLMICLPVVHSCIDLRNAITNCMCLLSIVDLGSTTTLILPTIPLTMILTTYPTLQWFTSASFSLLLSTSLLSCIESLVRNYIFFLTCILWSSSLWWPFSFIFLISFQVMPRLKFVL